MQRTWQKCLPWATKSATRELPGNWPRPPWIPRPKMSTLVDTETDARELCKAELEQSTGLLHPMMVKCLPPEMATIVASKTQARRLAKFPAEHRAEVVIAIVDAGQPVTAIRLVAQPAAAVVRK